MGKGVPGLRIKALLDGLAKSGQKAFFNRGTDITTTQHVPVNICSPDYSPAMRLLGKSMVTALESMCIDSPLMTSGGGLACRQGDVVSNPGPPVICKQSCLDRAACKATLDGKPLPRCPVSKFANPGDMDCGGTCPCWRIVRKSVCAAAAGTPYGLEILHKGQLGTSSVARLSCTVASEPWGSPALGGLPQCSK
jgi:hypothetical protein